MTGSLRLTFDDGPDPVWTPKVLDRLAAAEVTATFFVLGYRVRRHPELIDAIRAGGHVIGLHGDAHLDHSRSTVAAVEEDTGRALATLRSVGTHPTIWRLPWGRSGEATGPLASAHGLTVVHWDADTHDWRGDGWADQPGAVKAVAQTGGIVLLHDGMGPGQPRTGCANTLDLVDEFLAVAYREGTIVGGVDPD